MFGNIKERLSGQNVFITGASSGIGKQTAESFAEATDGNVKLILTARRENKLQEVKQALEAKYPAIKILVLSLDINEYKSIKGKLDDIPQEFKKVDVLINNAGLALGREPVSNMDIEDAFSMMNTNVLGLMALTHYFVPSMRENNSGFIINIGSIAGRNPYPGGSAYCGSKAAVKYFTRCLRKELIDTKVRVMEIAPGEVLTEFSVVRYKGDEDKAANVYKNKEPLLATDIAELIIFSCSRREQTVLAETVILPTYQG